MNDVPENLGRA